MKIASKGLGWSFESTCAVNVLNGLSFGLLLTPWCSFNGSDPD